MTLKRKSDDINEAAPPDQYEKLTRSGEKSPLQVIIIEIYKIIVKTFKSLRENHSEMMEFKDQSKEEKPASPIYPK